MPQEKQENTNESKIKESKQLSCVLCREVLDPFSGSGTIPFEAALNGRESYGLDIGLLATTLSNAKMKRPNRNKVTEIIESLEKEKSNNSPKGDLIKSVFTSALAIKWPENEAFSGEFKTSVNLFRTLFSYLSDDTAYLKELEDEASYLVIKKEAPYGVYKTIDAKGEVVFEKH